jgi:hypothetical protein
MEDDDAEMADYGTDAADDVDPNYVLGEHIIIASPLRRYLAILT